MSLSIQESFKFEFKSEDEFNKKIAEKYLDEYLLTVCDSDQTLDTILRGYSSIDKRSLDIKSTIVKCPSECIDACYKLLCQLHQSYIVNFR